MRVDALASGSSGNAYLVRSGPTSVLLEAGLSAARLSTFLAARGIDPRQLAGILLTHAHSDHLRGARALSDRYGVPIFATAGTLGHRELRNSRLARPIAADRTFQVGELDVLPFAVPHDCAEPVAFRISGEQATICLATDLGFIPDGMAGRLAGAELVILEANHDEELLWRGPYPPFLKRRVSGDHGHLSNAVAARCLAGLQCRPPREVWLAHLSVVNNRVSTAVDAVRSALAAADLGHVVVAAAGRNRPSLRWSATPSPRQLALF